MVILREGLKGIWESKTESLVSFVASSLGYRSFWRLGNTLVSWQIRRFNSPTVSSPQTRTVYSFPLHFTISVSSSSEYDDVESETSLAIFWLLNSNSRNGKTSHLLRLYIYKIMINI